MIQSAVLSLTSQTSVTFTGVPAGAKQIIVSLFDVNIGSNGLRLRLGSAAGVVTTGYSSFWQLYTATQSYVTGTAGFDGGIFSINPWCAQIVLTLANPYNNTWVGMLLAGSRATTYNWTFCGRVSLPGSLDRIEISLVNAGTFSAGKVSYLADVGVPVGSASDTKLLLHMDGANNGVVFPDASPYARGNATVGGNAKVSTAQSVFGGASGLFDGSSYLTLPFSDDFNFGTGDFTVDFRVRPTSVPGGIIAVQFGRHDAGNNSWFVYLDPNHIYILFYLNGSQTPNGMMSNYTLNAWTHIAFVRNGNNWTGYKDGVYQSHFTDSMAVPNVPSGPLVVGGYYAPAGSFVGNLDELRISKGIARWPFGTEFTPPTAPYRTE